MSATKLTWLVAALTVFALVLAAQEPPPKIIQHAPMKATSAASGQEMFTSYCAACHGKDGKGGGPAADALKVPPADLTVLAKNNGGKYPAMKVISTLHGEVNLQAHGSKDMPVWGSLFLKMSGGHEAEVQQRVSNLTKYIESLQVK
jgi:mono/diheme cytochrome c family protein